eukprot:5134072-Pyramimonas_sp.AAC.1
MKKFENRERNQGTICRALLVMFDHASIIALLVFPNPPVGGQAWPNRSRNRHTLQAAWPRL